MFGINDGEAGADVFGWKASAARSFLPWPLSEVVHDKPDLPLGCAVASDRFRWVPHEGARTPVHSTPPSPQKSQPKPKRGPRLKHSLVSGRGGDGGVEWISPQTLSPATLKVKFLFLRP